MMIGEVKRLTAIFYGVTKSDIEGPRRSRKYAWPRQVGMALCRHYSRASLPQIGAIFGGRDHTTVLHAIRATTLRIAENEDHRCDIRLLCGQIEAGTISQTSLWAARERLLLMRVLPDSPPLKAPARHAPIAGLRWSYAQALAAVHANFAPRVPVHTQPDRALPVPRVLLLRGPVFSTGAAA